MVLVDTSSTKESHHSAAFLIMSTRLGAGMLASWPNQLLPSQRGPKQNAHAVTSLSASGCLKAWFLPLRAGFNQLARQVSWLRMQ